MTKQKKSELTKNKGPLNKKDYDVMRKKPKAKKKPRSSKKLPPIKREKNPDADQYPEAAFLNDWIETLIED